MTNRQQLYRARWHDYRSRCIYMITLNKRDDVPEFGRVAGDWSLPVRTPGASFIELSEIGRIVRNTLYQLHCIELSLRLLQYSVMPDHLHFLIFIQQPTVDPLGSLIARFKVTANKNWNNRPIFTEGYNDQILKFSRSLDTIIQYIKQNPYRLAIRLAFPHYFQRINNVSVAGSVCQTYGNLFLLHNPFKEAVIIHRKDTEETKTHLHDQWLYTAANGGVLVSPFISPAEKAIRQEAENVGGRIILIQPTPFPERYKPSAHNFEMCSQGRLLIIVPRNIIESTRLSRSNCLLMNSLAEKIASQ